MLDELISLTLSIEFEEYGTLNLEGATCAPFDYDPDNYSTWQDPDVVIKLSLKLDSGDETGAQQTWEVECAGVRDHQLLLGQCDGLSIYNDHALLWPYTAPQALVSFYGEAKDPSAVVIALMNCHLDLTDDFLPFRQYMNGNPFEMIAGRYGVLAEGPMPLMEAYANVLESFGIGNQIAKRKLGSPSAPDLDDIGGFSVTKPEVLVLQRGCYVVASRFTASRVE